MNKSRSKQIIKCGWLFILVNFLLAVFNFVVGIISNSLAIATDAAHSLIDAISGVLVIVTEKFASMQKYAKHRDKIERLATIMIALIIIATGVELIVLSIKDIFAPEEVDYPIPVIIILCVSLLAKYGLAMYLKKTGRRIKSKVVEASGAETLNDCWISIAVLLSAIIYLIWHVNIEAYVSVAISFVIIKIGLEFIFPHALHHHHHHLEENHDHGVETHQ